MRPTHEADTPLTVRLWGVAQPLALRAVRYAAGAYQPPHAHDWPTISLVLAGSLHETVGTETVSVELTGCGQLARFFFGTGAARAHAVEIDGMRFERVAEAEGAR